MTEMNKKLPTRQQIERRAYEIYAERGCQNGNGLADWLTAEKELTISLNDQHEAIELLSTDHQQKCRPTPTFLDFYGMREQPFGMTPDPAYLYASRTHSEALASLSFGIQDNRGFLALVAEPGMGKTTLLFQLLEELRDSTRTVFVFQTQCNSREFLQYILHDLGVDDQGMGLVAMHNTLNEILFEEMLAGKRVVLAVDEAQNLDDSVLETVRMLSNFETHNTKLLQIILAGQLRLAAKLAQPRLSQLRQRIAVLTHLEPLTAQETGLYVEHRLKVAGYRGEPLFEPNSVSMIAQQSQGIPRNINNICYNSLLLSYARGHRTVTSEIVQAAVAQLDVTSLASEPAAVADSVASPIAPPTPPEVSRPDSAPIAVPISKDHQTKPQLTYNAGAQVSLPRWPLRFAILVGILLLGNSLPTFLDRSEPIHEKGSAILDHISDTPRSLNPANPSEGATIDYDAAPQDTGTGQVLTVMAGPQQTLKDLSLRYLGHFDSDLSKQICSLNPELKDPDHLEAGQLIRIPLPPGAMRKVNDTAETTAASKPGSPSGLFTRVVAFLRDRK
jgi:type II secretory pathway predicted ATPase ExeA